MAKYPFNPDYAVPPGATLKETLESKGISRDEFCAQTGLSVDQVDGIISSALPITPETAERLAAATGIPASFWNNGERRYSASR